MQEPNHIKHKSSTPKHAQARSSTPKHSEQLLGAYGNLLNLKRHEIFDFKKTSYEERRKKEEQSSL